MKALLVLASGVLLSMATAVAALGQTLTTDKPDYQPGEMAALTGTGFVAGEDVLLQVLHADATADSGGDHGSWTVVADGNGDFATTWHVCTDDCVGSTLKAVADGQTSGLHADVTFTDGGQFSYSPSTSSLSCAPGGSASFSQAITAPKNNGSFSAGLLFSGTGSNKIPSGWVSASPSSLNFVTTSGSGDTQSWTVTFNPPSGTTPGTYTGNVKAHASSGPGDGPGTDVTLTVSACTSPGITCPSDFTVSNETGTCGAHVTFSATGSGSPTPTISYAPKNPGDLFAVGTTTITATATNSCGSASCSFTVTVNDVEKPVITVAGANPLTVECHGTFTDPGATASDVCAGNRTGSIVASGSVDANTVGSYSRTYTVSDGHGNSDTKTRTVNVVDTQLPSISLVGANPLTVECHGTFTDPGTTASDVCAGNLTGNVASSGSVDANTVGTYTRTYAVSDGQGHSDTKTRTVNVVDTQAPTITVAGASPLTV